MEFANVSIAICQILNQLQKLYNNSNNTEKR